MLAPLIIFAYRRPEHLRRTLLNLMKCEGFYDSQVIFFGDGPKNSKEIVSVEETRRIAIGMLGIGAEYHFSEINQGISKSIINGVNHALNKYERVIVLEDDLLVRTDFILYMNRALDLYEKNEKVFQISGYQFDIEQSLTSNSAMFLPFLSSWGWGTWKRAWLQFDREAHDWEKILGDRKLRYYFNLDGNYPYANILVSQMKGLCDSWAIRWYWSVFKLEGLVLYPPISKVKNIGFDGSGTHGKGFIRYFNCEKKEGELENIEFPVESKVDKHKYSIIKKTIWRINGGWRGSLLDWLKWNFIKIVSKK